MGLCFDCLVTLNGEPNIRARITFAKPGDNVEEQYLMPELLPAPLTVRGGTRWHYGGVQWLADADITQSQLWRFDSSEHQMCHHFNKPINLLTRLSVIP